MPTWTPSHIPFLSSIHLPSVLTSLVWLTWPILWGKAVAHGRYCIGSKNICQSKWTKPFSKLQSSWAEHLNHVNDLTSIQNKCWMLTGARMDDACGKAVQKVLQLTVAPLASSGGPRSMWFRCFVAFCGSEAEVLLTHFSCVLFQRTLCWCSHRTVWWKCWLETQLPRVPQVPQPDLQSSREEYASPKKYKAVGNGGLWGGPRERDLMKFCRAC